MIEQKQAFHFDKLSEREEERKNYKPTRRDKRAERELLKFKDKISDASGSNFDEMSEKPMNPGEMDDSLLAIASQIKPTKSDYLTGDVSNKKYIIDPDTGDKTRLKGNAPRKSSNTKSERKKERSLAFWDKL